MHASPRRLVCLACLLAGGYSSGAEQALRFHLIEDMPYLWSTPVPAAVMLPDSQFYVAISLALAFLAVKFHRDRQRLKTQMRKYEETERILQNRESEYRSLYENAPLAFVTWGTDLRIQTWNRAAEKLFGWKEKEVVGRPILDVLIPEHERARLESYMRRLPGTKDPAQINENLTKDGRVITCRWHNLPRKNLDGEVVEIHSIAVDITRDLEEKNRLKTEVGWEKQNSQAKSRLLAETSHEIKTPLNAILGFAEILHEDAQDEETRKMTAILRDAAVSMDVLLSDLLDASKLEAGRLVLHETSFELCELIRSNVELFRHAAEQKGLEIDCRFPDAPCPIRSDSKRLAQIAKNLLSNATKFTHEGRITVSVEAADSAPARPGYRICVEDSGMGITRERLERIFEPFEQAHDDTENRFGGTGLGLALSRQLAEHLGGELKAESEYGEGSRFVLWLPRNESGEPREGSPPA
ncbi:MAG: PAS domain-containing sensor histidine kinase [Verrucomicrobiota bacterium]